MHVINMEIDDCDQAEGHLSNRESKPSIDSINSGGRDSCEEKKDTLKESTDEGSLKEDEIVSSPAPSGSASPSPASPGDKQSTPLSHAEGSTGSPSSLNLQQQTNKEANGDQKSRNLNLIACEDCGLVCAGQSHYQVHVRSHTGERPFKCTVCGVAFTQKGNLRRHYKIHSEEKPFQCPVCSYRCRRRDALNGHMRIHSDIRPYRCVYCARSYKSRQSLKEHEYQCNYKNDPITQSSSSPKLSNVEQDQSKSSPKMYNQTSSLQPPTSLNLTSNNQNLLNYSSSHLGLGSSVFGGNSGVSSSGSSSGKRKASNPQKYTRLRDSSLLDVRGDSHSPSFHMSPNMGVSVANALQFMPSVISSMMQQHIGDESKSMELDSSSPQSAPIDFSSKKSPSKHDSDIPKPQNNIDKMDLNEPEDSLQTSSYSKIGGEFFLTSSPLLNGEMKRENHGESFRRIDDHGQFNQDDHKSSRIPNNDLNITSQMMEKLTGSARRKRPRYMNEKLAEVNDHESLFGSKNLQGNFNNSPLDVSRGRSLLRSSVISDVTSSDHRANVKLERFPNNAHASNSEADFKGLSFAKSGVASRAGLKVFTTQGGERGDEIEELPAYVCVHCRCIFLDHVMFSIHAGCHGYRDPFECTVCGHLAADRFQFVSHLTRGEHVMAVGGDRVPSKGEALNSSNCFNKSPLDAMGGMFSVNKLSGKGRRHINELSLH